MIARIPANAGAPTEVPPTAFSPLPLSRNPFVQLGGFCWPGQKRNGSWAAEAFTEMSGTSRAPSLGTPGPVCQIGLGVKNLLTPPPPAENVGLDPWIDRAVSFHAISGIYISAVGPLFKLEDPLQ